jgi:hypothetical protein
MINYPALNPGFIFSDDLLANAAIIYRYCKPRVICGVCFVMTKSKSLE